MKSAAGRGSAVGVDAHDGVGAHRIGQRGAFVDAGPNTAVAIPRQLSADAHLGERSVDKRDDRPVEGMLRVAVAGRGPRGVALLGAAPTVGDLSGDGGVADAVVAGVEEDGLPGETGGRAWGAQQCAGAEYRRRDTGVFHDIAP